MQNSTMKSYRLFFLASSSKSSPVFFLKLRSTEYVSNHILTISRFYSGLMSPERIAQNKGVFLLIRIRINGFDCLPFGCLEVKDVEFVGVILHLVDEKLEDFCVSVVRSVVKHGPIVAGL